MELVQCCHKRKVPTLVIKHDFAKAFNTINWDALDTTFKPEASVKTQKWHRCVMCILRSSYSAILVNGVPGPQINYCCDVWQGDPKSPYLFILVANVLQFLIKADGGIRHLVL